MKKRAFLFAAFIASVSAYSQTGPGGVGSTSTNGLWLKAEDVNQSNNSAVSSWSDASGNGNDAAQATTDDQPKYYTTSDLNGMPVVRLDGTDDQLFVSDADILDGTSGITYLAVIRPNNLNNQPRGILGKRFTYNSNPEDYAYTWFMHTSQYLNVDINTANDRYNSSPTTFSNATNYLLSFQFDGSLTSSLRSTMYSGGALIKTSSETSTAMLSSTEDLTIGALNKDYGTYLGADYAEVIHYNYALNAAEQTIVNNYLSAKYDVTLDANDYYTHDDLANGDFDFHVAGIGQAADASNHTNSRGSGIVTMHTPSDLNNDEYLFWGEENNSSSYSFANNGKPDYEKLTTAWRVNKRNDLGTVTVSFDITNVDLTGKDADSPLQLFVDNNSSFGSPTEIYDLSISGNTATATGVSFSDDDYFTLVYGTIGYNADGFYGGSGTNGAPDDTDDNKMFVVSADASLSSHAQVSTFFVSSGYSLTLQPNVCLAVDDDVFLNTVEGLVLESDATGTANFIENGIKYRNSATIKIERYLDAGSGIYLEGYHYMSSPINNMPKFTDMTDLYTYRESDLSWLHHADPTDGFTNFAPGMGYAIRYITDVTKDFVGEVNNGTYSTAITSTNMGGSFEHFNLVGNPYSCSISANDLVDANSSLISTTVYFWNGLDYATYNTSLNAGTAGSLGATPDDNISVGQGFYVDATGSGNLSFENSMRTADSDVYFRKESFPQLRLTANTTEGRSDVLLAAHRLSTNGVDDYDTKHLPGNGNLSITTLINDLAYDIQSVPSFESRTFDLQVVSKTSEEVSFAISDMKDLKGMTVYIEDNGVLVDITNTPYTTLVKEGVDLNRFKLRIAKVENDFSAWIDNGVVKLSLSDNEMVSEIRLIALNGKTISVSNHMNILNWNHLASGVYLLEVSTNQGKHIQKIIK